MEDPGDGRTDRGLDAVVAPHRTRDGGLSWAHGAFRVALFDYIEGHTGMDVPLTPDDLQQTATVLAAIHCSGHGLPVAPHREDFSNPFRDTLLRLLRESEAPRPADRSLQRRTRYLFAQQRADILATADLAGFAKGPAIHFERNDLLLFPFADRALVIGTPRFVVYWLSQSDGTGCPVH